MRIYWEASWQWEQAAWWVMRPAISHYGSVYWLQACSMQMHRLVSWLHVTAAGSILALFTMR